MFENEQEMNMEVFEELLEDLDILISKGLKARIVFPDWTGFQACVEEKSMGFSVVEVFPIEKKALPYRGYDFDFTQTRIVDDYEDGSIEQGYGFKNFSCLDCGNDSLFYDTKRQDHYCPLCE